MCESLSPMRFRSLHPQYDKLTSEQYCAAMQAVMGLSKQPDGVDWQDLPDRDKLFVHHRLNETQQDSLTKMVEKFQEDKILVKEVETYGKAKVRPFDVELINGGEAYLAKKQPKAYALKGELRDHMKKALQEIANYTMEYIKGKDNVLSDTMSRPNIAAATVAAVMLINMSSMTIFFIRKL